MTTPDDKTLDDLVRLCRDEEYGTDLSESCADAIAALRERIAALTERSKLDPLSHAWKSGYAQAVEERTAVIAALEAERDALLKVVGDACDWVGVLDTTNDVANHALRKQWIVRARAALKEPTK